MSLEALIFIVVIMIQTMKAEELNKIQRKASSRWYLHKFLFYLKPNNFTNYLLPKLSNLNDLIYLVKIFYRLLTEKISIVMTKS